MITTIQTGSPCRSEGCHIAELLLARPALVATPDTQAASMAVFDTRFNCSSRTRQSQPGRS